MKARHDLPYVYKGTRQIIATVSEAGIEFRLKRQHEAAAFVTWKQVAEFALGSQVFPMREESKP